MPDDRFAKMMDQVRACTTKEEAGKLIGKARQYFIFDEEQENILRQWEDNING